MKVWFLTLLVVLCSARLFVEASSSPLKFVSGFKPTPASKLWKQQYLLNHKHDNDGRVFALPDSFDSRSQWPQCVHPIRDQGQCGSCWAFGAVESLSDRFCIFSKNAVNVILSPQEMVSCDLDGAEGCGGGEPVSAFTYASLFGLVPDSCIPYTSGGGDTGYCPSECTNSSGTWKKYYSYLDTLEWHFEEQSIMNDIYNNGPVEACFEVYADFMNYTSGVYVQKSDNDLGGHCIKVIGWGVTATGVKYWICANSWGTDWGMNGYFWIQRGVDMCGIESEVYSIHPDV